MIFSIQILSFLYWNPSPEILPWRVPLIDRPILWYGVLFSMGIFLAYRMVLAKMKKIYGEEAQKITERALVYVVIGTLVGARLGDVLLYQDVSHYLHYPLDFFRTWEGGLASHGAVIGIILALYLLSRTTEKLTMLAWCDLCAVPACVGSFFIRMGNFFNQEILGVQTSVPWAITFGSPAGGGAIVPRHPVQLYEAFFYIALAFACRRGLEGRGRTIGVVLTSIFSFRFFVEFFKVKQSVLIEQSSPLSMGHYLSLPLIAFGIFLIMRSRTQFSLNN